MFRRFLLMLVVCSVVFMGSAGTSKAQSSTNNLTYGATVTGELTDKVTSLVYTFAGKEGDIVVLQLIPDQDHALIGSTIRVTDDAKKKIVDSSDLTVEGRTGTILGFQLSKSGDYTITISPSEFGDKTGKFELALANVPMLEVGKPVKGTISTGAKGTRGRINVLYAIQSKDDFTVTYQRSGGDFAPTVELFSLDKGNLLSESYMGGDSLNTGSLSADGSKTIQFVSLNNRTDFSVSTEQSADFTLTMTPKPAAQ